MGSDAVRAYNRRMAELTNERELCEAFRELRMSELSSLMAEHPRLYFALSKWVARQEIRSDG